MKKEDLLKRMIIQLRVGQCIEFILKRTDELNTDNQAYFKELHHEAVDVLLEPELLDIKEMKRIRNELKGIVEMLLLKEIEDEDLAA